MSTDKDAVKKFVDGLNDNDKDVLREHLKITPDGDVLDAINDAAARLTALEEASNKKGEEKEDGLLSKLAGIFK